MRNYWLARRPRILQNSMSPDYHGKWYIIKIIENVLFWGYDQDNPHIYLHKDGIWRDSTWNEVTRDYDGYYDTFEDAEVVLLMYYML